MKKSQLCFPRDDYYVTVFVSFQTFIQLKQSGLQMNSKLWVGLLSSESLINQTASVVWFNMKLCTIHTLVYSYRNFRTDQSLQLQKDPPISKTFSRNVSFLHHLHHKPSITVFYHVHNTYMSQHFRLGQKHDILFSIPNKKQHSANRTKTQCVNRLGILVSLQTNMRSFYTKLQVNMSLYFPSTCYQSHMGYLWGFLPFLFGHFTDKELGLHKNAHHSVYRKLHIISIWLAVSHRRQFPAFKCVHRDLVSVYMSVRKQILVKTQQCIPRRTKSVYTNRGFRYLVSIHFKSLQTHLNVVILKGVYTFKEASLASCSSYVHLSLKRLTNLNSVVLFTRGHSGQLTLVS